MNMARTSEKALTEIRRHLPIGSKAGQSFYKQHDNYIS
jgi:hypothetical protein